MSRHTPAIHLAWIIAMLVLWAPSATRADSLRLALDVDQGVIVDSPAPFAFGVKLAPGIDFGKLRLSITAGAVFPADHWDFAVGFAPSLTLWAPLSDAPCCGVRLVSEAAFLVDSEEYRATTGVMVDLDGFHIGPLVGYDSLHDAYMVLTTIGCDLPRVLSFIFEDPF